MYFAKEFEEFCTKRGNTLRVDNRSRTYEDIKRALEGCADVEAIDKYVCNQTSRKETVRKIMVAFFKYLEQEKGEEILSVLFDTRFYDYPFERQLEIAKYLHEPRKLVEIEEHFNISDETRKKDIRALEEGIEVMGARISIHKERRHGEVYYKSTLHPVFLPLNLTEVYALTTYLEQKLDPDDKNTEMILSISERIKGQLSDTAYKKLYHHNRIKAIDNSYVDDESLARDQKGIRMYLMKRDKYCPFLWEGKEYAGTVKYRDDDEYIVLENGERFDADPNDVYFLTEYLDYE